MFANDAKMVTKLVDKLVKKSPNWLAIWSPKMMPILFYRQNFAKFSLNRHYNVLDESRSFFRVHTGYFSNIPKCIKAEFIASWGCSQSSVVSSSKR
ncbi:hypothetical protein TNCV_1035651 [Trichonephila clavipes]|nr:hypothetical protein TNCV_1035651 [Trichonephila clavipes]